MTITTWTRNPKTPCFFYMALSEESTSMQVVATMDLKSKRRDGEKMKLLPFFLFITKVDLLAIRWFVFIFTHRVDSTHVSFSTLKRALMDASSLSIHEHARYQKNIFPSGNPYGLGIHWLTMGEKEKVVPLEKGCPLPSSHFKLCVPQPGQTW